MKIYVDADACPVPAKEALIKVSDRLNMPLIFIANQFMRLPLSGTIQFILVAEGADVADDKIVELVETGELVITADIPLADRCIKKGAQVLDARGESMNLQNIGGKLATRNLMEELRNNGMQTKGPSAYSKRDKQDFANALHKLLSSYY